MATDEEKSVQVPATVYHYTTQEGLLKILSEGILWATKLQYLNDFTEFQRAPRLAYQVLEAERGEVHTLGECSRIEALLDESKLIEHINVCGCSFSEERDLLSMWRAYGGSAGGFSLGFRTTTLSRLAEEQGFRLAKCSYDVGGQRAAIESMIDEILGVPFETCFDTSFASAGRTVWPVPTSSGLLERLARLAGLFKDPGFCEEKEWRLVSDGLFNDRLCYRQGKSMIVPFYKFRLGSEVELYLDSVTVGPCPHVELAQASVQMFLAQLGCTGRVEVYPSHVPYRSW